MRAIAVRADEAERQEAQPGLCVSQTSCSRAWIGGIPITTSAQRRAPFIPSEGGQHSARHQFSTSGAQSLPTATAMAGRPLAVAGWKYRNADATPPSRLISAGAKPYTRHH